MAPNNFLFYSSALAQSVINKGFFANKNRRRQEK